ncbi:cbb3-type cytochrome c oxidase subunit 3 [Bosea beijingensis]
MSQSFISTAINGWLVAASVLFAVIVWRTFRCSARADMDRNARIPFENEGGEP